MKNLPNGHIEYRLVDILNNQNKNNCMKCRHYESFFDMFYGDDPHEPKDCGSCLNDKNWSISEGIFPGESWSCSNFEQKAN